MNQYFCTDVVCLSCNPKLLPSFFSFSPKGRCENPIMFSSQERPFYTIRDAHQFLIKIYQFVTVPLHDELEKRSNIP